MTKRERQRAKYQRWRQRHIEEAWARERAYARSEAGRARNRRAVAKWKARFPERARASRIARDAVRKGIIIRPARCEARGCAEAPRDMHHPDYSKPTHVEHFCRHHHIAADAIRRAAA